MSIQVSSVPEQTGISNAAQQRLDFANHLINLAKQSPSVEWLKPLRDRSLALIQEQSFPTTKDEEWRFTDLSDLVKLRFEQIDRHSAVNVDAVTQFALAEESTRLVFVNGMYAPELSTIASRYGTTPSVGTIAPETGLTVSNLSGVSEAQRSSLENYLGQQPGAEELFTALNTAGISDAAVIKVAKNQAIEAPVHLLFVSTTRSTPTFIQPRALVIAEPNSELTIVEEYVSIGEEQSFTNSVTEIFLAENAQISHTRIQRDSLAAFHIGKTAVSQARTARYTCNAIDLGGKLARHHLEIYQTGEQTETYLNGLTFIGGEQFSDTHSTIALTQPYGTTRQLHKCIVDDRAHAVFNGKVFVPQAAQQTDAGQLNRNLLLSSKARVDTKPQLEIVADNVKCTHGATVSQLDDDEVFYLRSRGIDAASAERLLVYAFAYEVIDCIPVESLKQSLIEFVRNYHSRPCGIR